ncbi:hypothetical protein SAMN06265379_101263 [Saccharicrinis carchari]|uniref:Uncharacterized protein n=1 Tax=Saccharicrinis carchari TaxID=1168039 RepID=A0A521AMR2_SACCC|nr:hypothetical protein SAMN06265379_101263 [Saccharicrinis carchari]
MFNALTFLIKKASLYILYVLAFCYSISYI